MRLLPTSVFAIACLLLAPLATAQNPPRPTVRSKSAEADRRRAIELFRQSEGAYQEGRFEEAARLLREAYALDPAPTLLYNLARALESAGDLDGAVRAYRDYLARDPGARDRPAIERRIENLDRQIKEREDLKARLEKARQDATARPPPPPPPPPAVVTVPVEPAPSGGASAVPWIVTGVGAAGVAAGGILGVMAKGKHEDAMNEPKQAESASLDDSARGLATGANVAYIAGGAVLLGGLVWAVIDLSSSSADDEIKIRPEFGPGALGVFVEW